MSSNFKDFRIETVNGKIQNVSSLCSFNSKIFKIRRHTYTPFNCFLLLFADTLNVKPNRINKLSKNDPP